MNRSLVLLAIVCACHGAESHVTPTVASAAPTVTAIASVTLAADASPSAAGVVVLTSKSVPFPGATGTAFLDYVAYERPSARVWVPVGSTGSVDVFDVATSSFTRVDGFKTTEREAKGKKRTMGPSAASVGDGFVYIGNRATNEVCPVDVKTLKSAACVKLASPTDGVVYVAASKEVWVTTPSTQSLSVLDASAAGTLKVKTTVKTDGEPEGYAVDEAHGMFFTNLEDKGPTVVIDIKTHKVKTTWNANCGSDGPRGLTFDAARNFLVVACTDHVQVLDAGHDGAALGKLDTGEGVDNIDFMDGKVYVAAGKSAKLTVARLDDKGQFTVVATGDTSPGARNAVADEKGNVFVGDSLGSRLLVFAAPH